MSVIEFNKVAFVGLGNMGMGMAKCMLLADLPVIGYDLNPSAVSEFTVAGGVTAHSVADASTDADGIVIVVLNAEQAEDVLFGHGRAAESLPEGALVMLCSTVQPEYAVSVGARLVEQGLLFLDAPISGGAEGAASCSLSVLASGSREAFAKAAPILEVIAENVYEMGSEPGQGSAMKLVNQILAGINLAASTEAFAFGAKLGIDPEKIYEVISNSAGQSWMFENRVPHILADDYTPHSIVDIWTKDFGIIMEAGKNSQFPLPISAAAQQLWTMAAAAGYGRLDDAAVVKVFEKLADFHVVKR